MSNTPNRTFFENVKILYPDFTGTGLFNKYGQPLFNIVISQQEAEMMEASHFKVETTKPSQQYPQEERYVKILMGYEFLNRNTGMLEPSSNPPEIVIHDLSKGTDIIITHDNLDVLSGANLRNVNIVVSQSAPKPRTYMGQTVLRAGFYLRSMEADLIKPYVRPVTQDAAIPGAG